MSSINKKIIFSEKNLQIIAWVIIAIGVIVRTAVFLQNRNLFIDEANLARNIYERNIPGLALPLIYEQYAPPVFLWIVKLCTGIFGYGEQAFRLYPFISGIASLVMLMLLLKELTSLKSLWYPLMLMTSAVILVRYSTELKQYSTDILIVLSLLLLAIKTDIQKVSVIRFAGIWSLAGTIAIWGAMPAVFVLSGVGMYYITICFQQKEYKKLGIVVLVGMFWIVQFVFYYLKILAPQANSDYLQNFHRGYFLFGLPNSKDQLMHNWYVCKGILEEAGGYAFLNWAFNSIMFVLGVVVCFYKAPAKGWLLVLPLVATIVAACLNQFSLIPRVAMFMIPLLLLLIGIGYDSLFSIKKLAWQIPIILIGIVCGFGHNSVYLIYKPFMNEQITDGMKFILQHQLSGQEIYVHHGARPAVVYYTEIHPNKEKWKDFKNAHMLWWDANYDYIGSQIHTPSGFLFTSLSTDELKNINDKIQQHQKVVDKLEGDQATTKCWAYIYNTK